MALYRYVKFVPRVQQVRSPLATIFSFCCMTAGFGLLLWIGWPILSFSISRSNFVGSTVSPIQNVVAFGSSLSPIVRAASLPDIPGSQPTEYTDANIWYPSRPQKKVTLPLDRYVITIPKLNITKAVVMIGSDDLSKSLIHYGGTALPGEFGRAIVFGHSSLPQFFKATDYKTIFSLLPSLKIGDTVYVEYDGITYRYEVYEMSITQPHDLSPLEQQYDDSYMTLITCVPPGTLWERLNVRMRLVRPE